MKKKIYNNYLYDVFGFSKLDILDDLGEEMNIDVNDLNKDSESEDEKNLNLNVVII